MVQDEQQNQKYSNNSSGGSGDGSGGVRSSKKLKQKKIPQRGLGVAQLEKIRLEEQQKKDAAAVVSSPCFVVPLPPSHYHQSSSSSSFPVSRTSTTSLFRTPPPRPISTLDILVPVSRTSTTSLFRTPPPRPISTLDILVPPPPPLPSTTTIYGSRQPASGGGGSSGRAVADTITTFTGQGHYSSIWNNEMNYNGDVPRLDHGIACLQNEASYPIWHSPPPLVIDRKQPHSSTMGSFPTFTSPSSGLVFPMELPSNQSFCSSSNNYTPRSPWPEEEQVVGIKRPWPFSLDNLPLAPKVPSIIQPIYKPEEPSLCGNSNGNGSTFKFEPGDCIMSEESSSSTVLPTNRRGTKSEMKHKNVIKESGGLDGDFLTLGPPATSSPSMNSKSKKQQSLASISFHYPTPEFDLHSSLASIEDPLLRPTGSSIEQQPILNFFPSKGQISGVVTTTNDHRRVEGGSTVDLNLKL